MFSVVLFPARLSILKIFVFFLLFVLKLVASNTSALAMTLTFFKYGHYLSVSWVLSACILVKSTIDELNT